MAVWEAWVVRRRGRTPPSDTASGTAFDAEEGGAAANGASFPNRPSFCFLNALSYIFSSYVCRLEYRGGARFYVDGMVFHDKK